MITEQPSKKAMQYYSTRDLRKKSRTDVAILAWAAYTDMSTVAEITVIKK